jgi:hypothetical protein
MWCALYRVHLFQGPSAEICANCNTILFSKKVENLYNFWATIRPKETTLSDVLGNLKKVTIMFH